MANGQVMKILVANLKKKGLFILKKSKATVALKKIKRQIS